MTDAEARKIQGIARSIAVKWHRPELADDFAQEAVIARLRWPNLDLEYTFINLLRKEYGSSRTPGGRARQIGERRAIRLDAPIDDADGSSALGHELVGDARTDPGSFQPSRDYSYLFPATPRRTGRRGQIPKESALAQIYRLRFEEELELKQIAGIFGKPETWAWFMLRKIQKRIMLEDGLEQVRETLEDDPGITQLEIDWIRL